LGTKGYKSILFRKYDVVAWRLGGQPPYQHHYKIFFQYGIGITKLYFWVRPTNN